MSVNLQGGCFVRNMREGTPSLTGTLASWHLIGRSSGARAISLRIMEFAPGLSPGIRNEESDEVLYLVESLGESDSSSPQEATVFLDGWPYKVPPQTAIYLKPGTTLTIENPGPEPIMFVSSQCPEPRSATALVSPQTTANSDSVRPSAPPIVRLSDRAAVPTADRWYRVLVDDEIGSSQVTQFVGSIPPGRAPDHFHNYEEVLFILRGNGRMWAGETNTPIGASSCIYLPKGQVHCVENTGNSELRLLGVFYPAGSPSVRYET